MIKSYNEVFEEYRVYVKSVRYIFDVIKINFEDGYLLYFDDQYSRSIPSEKLYEIAYFNNIILMRNIGYSNIFELDIVRYRDREGIVIFNEIDCSYMIFDGLDYYRAGMDDPQVYCNYSNWSVEKVVGNIFDIEYKRYHNIIKNETVNKI